MNRLVPFAIACFLLAQAAVPALAQTDIVPAPLPLGPEASVFFIHGPPDGQTQTNCLIEVGKVHGASTSGDRPIASNNPVDPCRNVRAVELVLNSNLQTSTPPAWNVWFVPAVPEGTKLQQGERITGQITMYTAVFNANHAASVRFGDFAPVFTLRIGEATLGTVTTPTLDPTSIVTNPEPNGAKQYRTYDLDFGEAPESASGPIVLTISVGNRPTDQSFRQTASRVGVATDEDRKGHITIPFATPLVVPEVPADNETATGNETNGENGNNTAPPTTGDSNETGHNDHSDQTHGDNNTTAPKEQGFLPGFETAIVVLSGLLAAMYATRGRGRRMAPGSG